MDFSKLRQRIVFLKPLKASVNSMGETVPVWIPFKPTINNNIQITDQNQVYLTKDNTGNSVLKSIDGLLYAQKLAIKDYAVWAEVTPMTGREYEQSQKLRAETTYKINTRYFSSITTDMKILYNLRTFDIVSVLNINERNTKIQIIATEEDNNGK